MKLWKAIAVFVVLQMLLVVFAVSLLTKAVNEIAENGGVKAVAARVWEGKK